MMTSSEARFVEDFIKELRQRANDTVFGASAEARVCALLADELQKKHDAYLNEQLSVAEAAEISGYDESSLRRWRAAGTITLCRRDIPRKPGHGVQREPRKVDVSQRHLSIADEVLHDMQVVGGRTR